MDSHVVSTKPEEQAPDALAQAKRSLGDVRRRLLDVAGRLGELRQKLSELAADADRQAQLDHPGPSSPA